MKTELAWVPRAAWALALLALLLIPLRIVGLGFLPEDDALRHAAKAVSGHDWNEILLSQDGHLVDHNPGWHWFLGVIHTLSGMDTDGLVAVSVCLLFALGPCRPCPGCGGQRPGWPRWPSP